MFRSGTAQSSGYCGPVMPGTTSAIISDKINLVTTLCSGVNEKTIIHGFLLSLPIETLQLSTFNIFCGQQRDVLSDTNSFSQTYKNIDIIRNINQETWLQQRNKVVKAAVDGMSNGSVSKFQNVLQWNICIH